jgi:hypothetical protein
MEAASDTADSVNRALRRRTPSLADKDVHELQPIKFGGSPTDPGNKIALSPEEHDAVTTWWRRLQRQMEKAK